MDKVTIYMPYLDYNDSAFDIEGTYSGSEDYIKKLQEEYEKSKDVVFNTMLDGNIGSYIGDNGASYKIGQVESDVNEKISYSPCTCTLYNEQGKPESVDGLIDYFAKGEFFIEMCYLDMETMEEEFDTELSVWKSEHNNINKYAEEQGGEWGWIHEPLRTLRLKFKNNANEDVCAELQDCKLVDCQEKDKIILFITKLDLIDSIDGQ